MRYQAFNPKIKRWVLFENGRPVPGGAAVEKHENIPVRGGADKEESEKTEPVKDEKRFFFF